MLVAPHALLNKPTVKKIPPGCLICQRETDGTEILALGLVSLEDEYVWGYCPDCCIRILPVIMLYIRTLVSDTEIDKDGHPIVGLPLIERKGYAPRIILPVDHSKLNIDVNQGEVVH